MQGDVNEQGEVSQTALLLAKVPTYLFMLEWTLTVLLQNLPCVVPFLTTSIVSAD